METTTRLLPRGRRPRCRTCGRELRPNFNSRREGTETVKVYQLRTFGYSSRYSSETVPVTEETEGAIQDGRGRWYVERERSKAVRMFRGTYGYDGNGHFCSLRCGYEWAVQKVCV